MSTRRWLEVEYHKGEGLVVRVRPALLSRMPPTAIDHWRAANKELLLAFRSFLDGAIERMERAAQEVPPGDGRVRRRIPVREAEPRRRRRRREAPPGPEAPQGPP
ncbi:MAG: hypothetical protein HY535_05220 [Chloroflexi bacterium]|nr:hypothetical protein [Chloroflexota bacterium]